MKKFNREGEFGPKEKRHAARLLMKVHHPKAMFYAESLMKEAEADEKAARDFLLTLEQSYGRDDSF